MVVVHRFRWFGWFVLCVAVILGCYLMSSRVAAERNKLTDIERSIATTQRDIRALETEFDTRANLAQLEQWNGDTLRLTAPVAGQYITDEAALARLDLRGNQPAQPGQPAAQMASLVVPSRPTGLATVQATTPAIRILPATAMAAPEPSLAGAVAEVRTATVERIKSRAVASLDRKLLSDSTIGDLMSSARAETGGAGR